MSTLIRYGAHPADSDAFCLLEACSLPPGTAPTAGLPRTDHPPDVCPVRAAFGRALNDAYGDGGEADAERTEDCGPLVDALRKSVV